MTGAASERALSWLLLEQYALGELDGAAARRVEAQLAVSAADRAALEVITSDASALPPLALPASPPVRLVQAKPPPQPLRGRAAWLGLGGVLAAAAAWALTFTGSVERAPGSHHTLKGGGELSVRIVSERGRDATTFAEEERFKVLVSCPPALTGVLDVVVFQAGERFRPLVGGAALPCGNGVPWPGAFSLDGASDVHVCVAPAVTLETASTPAALLGEGVCVHLTPRK